MATIRVEHTHDYTVMANHHFRDKNLSFKAKGLLSYMLSLPDDWDYTIAGLAKVSKDGGDSVRAAIAELEEAGYIRRNRIRNKDGTLAGTEYTVMEKPMQEKPMQEKPAQLNTNIPSTYRLSTDLPKEEDEKEGGAVAKMCDEGLSRVMSLYLERIEPMPSRTSVELLKGYVEDLGPDVCVRAIERAIDAGARKWTYIHAILKNCEKDGIRSLADWDAREAEQLAGRSTFKPPGVEEVAAYVRERGSRVDPQGFIDYYSAKGWMIGKNLMTDWKAACRSAEKWDMWNKPAQPGGRNKPVDRPEPSGNNFLQHGRNGLLRIKREEGEK